ncbi:hypothetical protein Poli38472_009496 [Pythium oligandrum]|uniref:Chromo domain-containing protein n=1 Tax=Pythium oligandrum TaxID=41045 RepID=A0A8K1CGB4_PYTOL|nr:hypothetical protein Poli38472_009496 [Pythium oligandrum]|eukprot:TMW62003.1 hypothetical protein Poli38472_009496 [Pythium oligandrum]
MTTEASKKRQLLFEVMHEGLDHALSALSTEELPSTLRRTHKRRSVSAVWEELQDIANRRREQLEGAAKAKKETKKKKEREAERQREEEKTRKKAVKKEKKEKKPVVSGGILNLSGPDLPLVITHTSASPRAVPPQRPSISVSPDDEVLTRLRSVPMLEGLEAGTNKYKLLTKWLNADMGRNTLIAKDILPLVKKIQRRCLGSERRRSSPLSSTPRKKLDMLSVESLDEQLRMEERERRRRRRLAASGGSRGRSSVEKKRPLGGFVVESEEEYESGGSDDEAEYESGDSNSSDEAEFEIAMDGDESPPRKADRRTSLTQQERKKEPSPRGASKTNASPKSNGTSPKQISATEQLAVVAARLREEEGAAGKKAEATYLTYNSASKNGKQKKKWDGSSASSAIVLEESDSDDDEKREVVANVVVKKQQPRVQPLNDEEESEDEAEFQVGQDDDGSSTDEDKELFDLTEEDVYVVESILEMKAGRSYFTNGRRMKEADLFLVKWDGYNELTWEPDANIPKRLVQFFRDRELAKRKCNYEIDTFRERREVSNSTTGHREVIYLIQWKGESQPYWDVRSNLPERTVIWLEKTSRVGRTVAAPPPRKKAKQK